MLKFRSGTRGLNEELGRHRGREGERSVSYVRKSVKVLVIFCGGVQPAAVFGMTLCVSSKSFLGMVISVSRVLIALKEHHLCLVISCGRGF